MQWSAIMGKVGVPVETIVDAEKYERVLVRT
jgi:hypothetical protein